MRLIFTPDISITTRRIFSMLLLSVTVTSLAIYHLQIALFVKLGTLITVIPYKQYFENTKNKIRKPTHRASSRIFIPMRQTAQNLNRHLPLRQAPCSPAEPATPEPLFYLRLTGLEPAPPNED